MSTLGASKLRREDCGFGFRRVSHPRKTREETMEGARRGDPIIDQIVLRVPPLLGISSAVLHLPHEPRFIDNRTYMSLVISCFLPRRLWPQT
jgi:hypothetical protein